MEFKVNQPAPEPPVPEEGAYAIFPETGVNPVTVVARGFLVVKFKFELKSQFAISAAWALTLQSNAKAIDVKILILQNTPYDSDENLVRLKCSDEPFVSIPR